MPIHDEKFDMRHSIIRIGLAAAFVGVPALPGWAHQHSIEVQPAQGNPGDVSEISGEGFGSGEMVQVDWDQTRVAKTRADEEGRFRLSFTVPADATPGSHSLKVTGRPSKLTATKSFSVLAPPTTSSSSTITSSTNTITSSTTTTTVAAAGSVVSSPSTTTPPTPNQGGKSSPATQPATAGDSGAGTGSSGGGEEGGWAGDGQRVGDIAPEEQASATRLAVGDEQPNRPIALAGVEVTPTTLGVLIVVALVLAIGLLMLWLYRGQKKEERQAASPWA